MYKLLFILSVILSACEMNTGKEFRYLVNSVEPDWSFLGNVVYENVDMNLVGEYNVTYISNNIEKQAVVIIYDNIDPLIELIGSDVYLEFNGVYIEPGYTVTDNYDSDLEVRVTNNLDITTAGEYEIVYSVEDSSGNSFTIKRLVIVDSDIVITLNGESVVSLEVGSDYIELGATVNKEVDIITEGEVNTEVVGTYQVKYIVNDKEIIREVNIIDTIAPVINLNGGNVSLGLSESYTELGVTVNDNYDTTLDVIIDSNLDADNVGTYYVNYSVTDSSGNTSTLSREVIVYDDIKPIINLIGEETVYINYGEEFIDPGVTATDNLGEVITLISGNVLNESGEYQLIYEAIDLNGNKASVLRTVIVKEEITSFKVGDTVYFDGTYYSNSYGGNTGHVKGKYIISRIVDAPYPYLLVPVGGTIAYGWTNADSISLSE